MKPLALTPKQAPVALAALRAAVASDAGRDWLALEASQCGYAGDLEALGPVDLAALAAALPDPTARAALVQRCVIVAMLAGDISAEALAQLRRVARALSVDEPALHQLHLYRAGHFRRLTLDVGRRSFVASKVKRIWKEEGLGGVWRFALQSRGAANPPLAARYVALEALGPDTLGGALVRHFRRSGFALPGEPKSSPEALLFHDLGHVLTGFGTDPEGEVQMGGFEAGYMGEDAFSITVFALFLFHLGAPIVPNPPRARGRFAVAPYTAARDLGRRLNTDLRYWDPWPHMEAPVATVRAQLALE